MLNYSILRATLKNGTFLVRIAIAYMREKQYFCAVFL